MEELTARARVVDPEAVVWRGDTSLDPTMRGLKVLGAPIGSDEFVRAQSPNTRLCCRGSQLCGISRAHGCSFYSVRHHVPISTCAWCDPHCPRPFRKPTTTRCGRVSANWLGLQVAQKVLAGQLVSPLTWEGWDCVSLQGVLRLPIVPVGPIAF